MLTGSILLMLPCSVRPGVHLEYIDSLYTSTSAVCVTGLVGVDAKDTFTPLGQFFPCYAHFRLAVLALLPSVPELSLPWEKKLI